MTHEGAAQAAITPGGMDFGRRHGAWKRVRLPITGVVTLAGMVPALWFAGCRQPAATPVVNTVAPTPAPADTPVRHSQPAPAREPFDGEKAFALLQKQCDFGVRPLGTEAHEKTREFLLAEMRKVADQTLTQEFTYHKMPVTNVLGVFYAEGATKPSPHPVLLMAHWDTRPIADGPYSSEIKRGVVFRYGPDGWKPTAPIMGADDGASGVAVLLELGRLFKQKRPPVGVVILLDDGEDYGDFEANHNTGDGVELGARYFADHYKETPAYGQPRFGILLDMVGAKNAFFPKEDFSQGYAPSVNDNVFAVAKDLGYGAMFRSNEQQSVGDDHLALNEHHIPTIDLIHPLPFGDYQTTGYTYWHTLQDTPDKCSAKSLQAVGAVVAEVVDREVPDP